MQAKIFLPYYLLYDILLIFSDYRSKMAEWQ